MMSRGTPLAPSESVASRPAGHATLTQQAGVKIINMTNPHTPYFRDISAEVMAEIAMGMMDDHAFEIAQCESRNHSEHSGDLWQCTECLRVFCWAEDANESLYGQCDDCWSRLPDVCPIPAVA